MTKKREETRPKQREIEFPCRHKFKKGASGYTVSHLSFRCKLCAEMIERPITREETKILTVHKNEERKRTQFVNGPYWDFCKTFKTPGMSPGTSAFTLQGFDLMEAVEKWADKWPDRVLITSCDDMSFTSSLMVFITGDEPNGGYWGTHCIVISQCDGQPPKEFFMYPGHSQGVLDVLNNIQKRHRRARGIRRPWPFKESKYEVKQCSRKSGKRSGAGSTTSRRRSPKRSGST